MGTKITISTYQNIILNFGALAVEYFQYNSIHEWDKREVKFFSDSLVGQD